MNTITDHSAITPESVLASVKEMLAISGAEFDRRSADFDRQLKKSREDFEQEMKKSREEFDRRSADFDLQLKKSSEDFERKSADFDRRMKKISDQIGGLSNSHGFFAEEYFFNSFENGQKTFFGEEFDSCKRNMVGLKYEDEYDIVLINGQSVGIVEVKYKVHLKDIESVIRKVNSFKINFDNFDHHRFYLGLASLAFNDAVEKECTKQGIAVIKQVGETVVVNDKHLKVFQ
jgi:hypothetical protein